ncbi:ras-related protein Rab-30 [Dermatophagoides farinae]|uniref:Ras- protein Rab-30 n=1 Tax=Dermatophagoides farinae TaxID=6954 RepID=A0A922HW92_DERFA|nr:ras-related protein Rab-30-like [Dermatophagoides farinae]KAH7644520.1 ras-related protein rab-30-like protein 2 [Dermatophagoides farinae]KAH9511545.1 Ras- protein Rab-30 [Dermatophagoides farinae]
MEDQTFLFKVILIGNSGVGKTCLARRFIQGEFPVNKGATIGVDFMIKPMIVNGIRVNLQLWDTAGQERFRAITQSYYRSAHCLVLVYDISSQPSFDSLSQWCRDIENYTTSSLDGGTHVLQVLVGNKCDKESEVPTKVGEQFANNHNFDMFMETSALQLDNVNQLFQDIAQRLVERKLSTMPPTIDSKQTNNHHQNGNNHTSSSSSSTTTNNILMNGSITGAFRLQNLSPTIQRIRTNCCSSN